MHPLELHIQGVIDRFGLLRRSSPVLVALSGGADSVALLSALHNLGYECIAAHCNFHLRGAESVRDMRHAEKIAAQIGVNIYIKEFNVAARRKKTGESVEMACRELRYAWFHDLLDRDYSQAIAVAHHREDNVETFFINMLRSSGLTGLTGMDYRRGFVVRPMLDVSRGEIESYLADKGLEYVIDSSNLENDYGRNRIRNEILPLLNERFPGATDAILATMRHLADSRELLMHFVDGVRPLVAADEAAVNVAELLRLHGIPYSRLILFELLKDKGLRFSQIGDIVEAVSNGRTGQRFDIGESRVAELDRGLLTFHYVAPVDERSFPVSLKRDILVPVHIEVTPHAITEFNPEREPTVMYLDMKALNGKAEFEIRHPRNGDRMRPYGMKGEKLVSDILKDAKFSSAMKRDVWLLTRNGVVLWIIGLRASDHFTLSPRTQRYLQLKYKN